MRKQDLVKLGFDEKVLDIIIEHGGDIIASPLFEREKQYIQHGTTTTYTHSLCVAYVSVCLTMRMSERRRRRLDMRSIVRGALLHDYFLYDWHTPRSEWKKGERYGLHGYTHAGISMRNARRDFHINDTEAAIIYSHMFPLNLTHIPTCREAAIVCLADKLCAGCETLSIVSYSPAVVGA